MFVDYCCAAVFIIGKFQTNLGSISVSLRIITISSLPPFLLRLILLTLLLLFRNKFSLAPLFHHLSIVTPFNATFSTGVLIFFLVLLIFVPLLPLLILFYHLSSPHLSTLPSSSHFITICSSHHHPDRHLCRHLHPHQLHWLLAYLYFTMSYPPHSLSPYDDACIKLTVLTPLLSFFLFREPYFFQDIRKGRVKNFIFFSWHPSGTRATYTYSDDVCVSRSVFIVVGHAKEVHWHLNISRLDFFNILR